MKKTCGRCGFLLSVMCAAPAWAGSASTTLSASVTVLSTCSITTTPVAFGAYDPAGVNSITPADNTGTVTIACTKGTTSPIGLDLGSNASGTTRRMYDGTDYLSYELYQDAARTTVWSNSGTARLTPAVAPSRTARGFTIYGRIAAGQNVGIGSYSDTVVATVNF